MRAAIISFSTSQGGSQVVFARARATSPGTLRSTTARVSGFDGDPIRAGSRMCQPTVRAPSASYSCAQLSLPTASVTLGRLRTDSTG